MWAIAATDSFASVLQMQKFMKAAKEGTKDGLEKTKAAVKRGRSFIRTRSLVAQGLGQSLHGARKGSLSLMAGLL